MSETRVSPNVKKLIPFKEKVKLATNKPVTVFLLLKIKRYDYYQEICPISGSNDTLGVHVKRQSNSVSWNLNYLAFSTCFEQLINCELYILLMTSEDFKIIFLKMGGSQSPRYVWYSKR